MSCPTCFGMTDTCPDPLHYEEHAVTCALNVNARHGCTCDAEPCRVHWGTRRKDAPGRCDMWDSDPTALRHCDFLGVLR